MAHSQCPWLLLNQKFPFKIKQCSLLYFSKCHISGKAPLYSCPTLDPSEDTEMCVEPKCIDVPSWQHKTYSNLDQTTVLHCSLLSCTAFLMWADKMKTIIYADFSWKYIATWVAAFSDLDRIHSQLNIFAFIDLNRLYAGNNPTLQYSLLQVIAHVLARYNTGCSVCRAVGR